MITPEKSGAVKDSMALKQDYAQFEYEHGNKQHTYTAGPAGLNGNLDMNSAIKTQGY